MGEKVVKANKDEAGKEDREYLESLTKEAGNEASDEPVDDLIAAEQAKEIAAKDEQIKKLERRNSLLESEYRKIYAKLNTGIAATRDIMRSDSSMVDDEKLIKDSMKGRYFGN